MNINDVKEWMIIADADFDSAKILNESVRKHKEVICYLCAQATEKFKMFNSKILTRKYKYLTIGKWRNKSWK